jgi:hypothetical protein
MLGAIISMEWALNQISSQSEDFLSVGATYAHDTHALCMDVAAFIFPTAINPPSDATISAVTVKLIEIVTDMERQLFGESAEEPRRPMSWPLLAQAGFLRQPDLVDFVLARVAEDRLEARLATSRPPLLDKLLDHADGNVAEAAQMLLAADSLHRHVRGNAYLALPAELLHKMCWRVVAAIEVLNGRRSPEVIASAKSVIARYDEGQTIKAAARKIVHFIDHEQDDMLWDPTLSGLHIYVAGISAALDIEHDHVLRLINASSAAPFAVMLAALGVTKDHAIEAMLSLKADTLTPREAALFDQGYGSMERSDALAQVNKWSVARAQFLAFGQQ